MPISKIIDLLARLRYAVGASACVDTVSFTDRAPSHGIVGPAGRQVDAPQHHRGSSPPTGARSASAQGGRPQRHGPRSGVSDSPQLFPCATALGNSGVFRPGDEGHGERRTRGSRVCSSFSCEARDKNSHAPIASSVGRMQQRSRSRARWHTIRPCYDGEPLRPLDAITRDDMQRKIESLARTGQRDRDIRHHNRWPEALSGGDRWWS